MTANLFMLFLRKMFWRRLQMFWLWLQMFWLWLQMRLRLRLWGACDGQDAGDVRHNREVVVVRGGVVCLVGL